MTHKWVRLPSGVLAGVCAGLARQLEVEAWLVRLIWILSVLFFGVGFLIYVIMMFTLPREDRVYQALTPKLLGVCLRISKRSNIEIGLTRFLAVLLALSSLGATVVGYIVLHFILEEKSPDTP